MSLMSLPTEVRRLIFQYVLHSPPDNATIEERLRRSTSNAEPLEANGLWVNPDDVRYTSWTRSEGLLYSTCERDYDSRGSSLLRLNNWQCYLEVKSLIQSLRSVQRERRIVASLIDNREEGVDDRHGDGDDGDERVGRDFLSVDHGPVPSTGIPSLRYEMVLHLTSWGEWKMIWIDVPVRAKHVDELRITLQNFMQGLTTQSEHEKINMRGMLYVRSKYTQPAIGWLLWSILERYLHVGVRAPNIQEPLPWSSDRRLWDEYEWYSQVNVEFSIGCVTISVDTGDDQSPSTSQAVEDGRLHEFRNAVLSTIPNMIGEMKRCCCRFPGVIESIAVQMDDEYQTWSLGDLLHADAASPGPPGGSGFRWGNSPATNRWMQTMRNRRRALGFDASI